MKLNALMAVGCKDERLSVGWRGGGVDAVDFELKALAQRAPGRVVTRSRLTAELSGVYSSSGAGPSQGQSVGNRSPGTGDLSTSVGLDDFT